MRRCLRWALPIFALSCTTTPEGSVSIVTGEETDVFSRAPAPVLLVTEKLAEDGTKTEISRATLPTREAISLGEQPPTEVGALVLSGLDAAGAPLVRGETLFLQWGALRSTTLEVFVQRTGEFARLPRGPAAFDALATTMVVGRYLFAANGTTPLLYDLLTLQPLTLPALPRAGRSVAPVDAAVLLIDEGGATTLDLASGQTFALDAPVGGNFAEIAGGVRVGASDGTQYVVGATRASGGATPRILVIDAAGKASFASLTTPREGACATYVDGRGLVVIGGSTSGTGAEVLAPAATVATALPFPADAIRGCGAATLDTTHVAIAGGAGPVRVIDLTCATDCVPATWPDPVPLVRVEAAALAPDAAFLVGDDAGGATHAYRASATGLREIPLKNARRGARLVPTPTHALAVVGGGAGIEQYLE